MLTVLHDIDLRPFNTFRLDAKCRTWIEYTSTADILGVLSQIGDGSSFMNIGAGSNLLFTGEYYDGVILHSRILDVTSTANGDGTVTLRAGAGVTLDELIRRTVLAGLWGLENLSGIPGEVGASAVQNVGAYGVEACQVIERVECYDIVERCFRTLGADEIGYDYRWSMFKRKDCRNRFIITYVDYRLSTVPRPKTDYGSLHTLFDNAPTTPKEVRNAIISLRNEKLPDVGQIGSAGSFFKNPVITAEAFENLKATAKRKFGNDCTVPYYAAGDGVKIPAAWLIERCGFKGMNHGDAAVWHKQPLVIVNRTGKATAREILELEKMIVDKVGQTFDIRLTAEVEHI